MEYTLKSGHVITDEDIEQMAQACEMGAYPGEPSGEVVVGRPRLSNEPLEVISFKVPRSLSQMISQAAENCGQTRSGFLRDAAMEKARRTLQA